MLQTGDGLSDRGGGQLSGGGEFDEHRAAVSGLAPRVMWPRRSRRSRTLVSVVGRVPTAAPSSDTVRPRPSARLASALISEAVRSRSTSSAASTCRVAWVTRCRASRADHSDDTDSDFTISNYAISYYLPQARPKPRPVSSAPHVARSRHLSPRWPRCPVGRRPSSPPPTRRSVAASVAAFVVVRSGTDRGRVRPADPRKMAPDLRFRWPGARRGRRVGLYAGESYRNAMTCANAQRGRFCGYLDGYVRRRPRPGAARTGASSFSGFRRSARCARRCPSPSPAARSAGHPSQRRIRASGPRNA